MTYLKFEVSLGGFIVSSHFSRLLKSESIIRLRPFVGKSLDSVWNTVNVSNVYASYLRNVFLLELNYRISFVWGLKNNFRRNLKCRENFVNTKWYYKY